MPSWLRFTVFSFQKGGSVPSTKLQGKEYVVWLVFEEGVVVKTHSICYGCVLDSRSGPVCRTVFCSGFKRWMVVSRIFYFHPDPWEMIQCEGCIFFKGGWWTNHQLAKNMVLSARDLETPRFQLRGHCFLGADFGDLLFPGRWDLW